jgi:hypothetical protein
MQQGGVIGAEGNEITPTKFSSKFVNQKWFIGLGVNLILVVSIAFVLADAVAFAYLAIVVRRDIAKILEYWKERRSSSSLSREWRKTNTRLEVADEAPKRSARQGCPREHASSRTAEQYFRRAAYSGLGHRTAFWASARASGQADGEKQKENQEMKFGWFLLNVVLGLYDIASSLYEAEVRVAEAWMEHPFLGPFCPAWVEDFDLRLVGVSGFFWHRRFARR